MLSPLTLAFVAFVFHGPRVAALAPVYDLAASDIGGFALVLAFTLAGVDIAARVAFPGPRL